VAARIRKSHQDSVREKIRATQLVNYLEKHALTGAGEKNAGTRVRAAAALLNKCLPDLARTEHTGEGGGPLTVEIVRFAHPAPE
jgi:hypothetical protein